jgi:hypothetical protein
MGICVALLHAGPARASGSAQVSDKETDQNRALQCLTLAIAYEAGFESPLGQQAVAEVILNRAQHPAYPKSVCGVVFQGSSRRTGCQFTFTCDGAMRRKLPEAIMAASRLVAEGVMTGQLIRQVGGATHYHADYVSPYWAPSLIRITKIGAHIFYRAPNASDMPARYVVRTEPSIDALGAIAVATDPITQKGPSIAPIVTPPPPVSSAPAFAPWGLTPPTSE